MKPKHVTVNALFSETYDPRKETWRKYPDLRFPYEEIPVGRFKDLVDQACEGRLSPGLVVPSLMALVSSLPAADDMDGARINQFICLLAMVGAGKDTAIDRAIGVLGLGDEGAFYTEYSPNGDRAVATLLGDKPPKKGDEKPQPGFTRHCIVTRELLDTLHKAKGESSSVLEIMQHLYDKNTKTFPDSKRKTIERVNCRTSWLTALPIGNDGEVDEAAFSDAFGRNTGRGLVSRFMFGFAEEQFDRRTSRNWKAPKRTSEDNIEIEGEKFVHELEPLATEILGAKVEGFAPGIEAKYVTWAPDKDASGRDTFHVLKVAILSALLSGNKVITEADWNFAVEFMWWQNAIREVFLPSKAKDTPQAQFNEKVMRTSESKTEKLLAKGKPPSECWLNWRSMSHDGKWYREGMDVERTIENLVKAGALIYKSEENSNGKIEIDKKWVRLAKRDNPKSGEK